MQRKDVAAYGCCVKGLVGKIPTVLPVERRCCGGMLRYDNSVEFLSSVLAMTAARFGPAFSD
jgi:hypothetical protein